MPSLLWQNNDANTTFRGSCEPTQCGSAGHYWKGIIGCAKIPISITRKETNLFSKKTFNREKRNDNATLYCCVYCCYELRRISSMRWAVMATLSVSWVSVYDVIKWHRFYSRNSQQLLHDKVVCLRFISTIEFAVIYVGWLLQWWHLISFHGWVNCVERTWHALKMITKRIEPYYYMRFHGKSHSRLNWYSSEWIFCSML